MTKGAPGRNGADPGSFKDPDARVFFDNGRVYRRFTATGASRLRAFADTGLPDRLISSGHLIGWKEVSQEEFPHLYDAPATGALVVEHPPIPFLSYCYEWSFEMLRSAALLHLELLRESLKQGYILKDATPYNVQFIGPRPVFIDVPSFVPWREGTPWQAYAQFCRLFLNPLLLTGLTGVQFQPWLRSLLEGIEPEDLLRLLSFRNKLRRGVMIDVVFHAWFNRKLGKTGGTTGRLVESASFGKKQMLGLVGRLEATLTCLKPPKPPSRWIDYDRENQYGTEAQEFKERFVDQALIAAAPQTVWDMGCNTGRYSLIAARHAKYVVALDRDPVVIDALHRRLLNCHPNVLPLVMDMLNPSPDQGWNQAERGGMIGRGMADFVLCLALIHHLAINGNIPFTEFIPFLAGLTNGGIIEFVPQADPMVQDMLRWREHVYPWYNQDHFEEVLQQHFRIVARDEIPGTHRSLYVFSK